MAKFVMLCPDCGAPLSISVGIIPRKTITCKCGKTLVAAKKDKIKCPKCTSDVPFDRTKSSKATCRVCNNVIELNPGFKEALKLHEVQKF